jgi:hypothetical protein
MKIVEVAQKTRTGARNAKDVFFKIGKAAESPVALARVSTAIFGAFALYYSMDERILGFALSSARHADGKIGDFGVYSQYARHLLDFGQDLIKISFYGYGVQKLWDAARKE